MTTITKTRIAEAQARLAKLRAESEAFNERRNRRYKQIIRYNYDRYVWYKECRAEFPGDPFYERMAPWSSGARNVTRILKLAERAGLFG